MHKQVRKSTIYKSSRPFWITLFSFLSSNFAFAGIIKSKLLYTQYVARGGGGGGGGARGRGGPHNTLFAP